MTIRPRSRRDGIYLTMGERESLYRANVEGRGVAALAYLLMGIVREMYPDGVIPLSAIGRDDELLAIETAVEYGIAVLVFGLTCEGAPSGQDDAPSGQ